MRTSTAADPDLAGNQEGGVTDSLRAEAQAFVAEHGLRLSGSRQRKLIAEYERTGGDISRMAFRSWLTKRGDLLVIPVTYRQVAARGHNWRSHS